MSHWGYDKEFSQIKNKAMKESGHVAKNFPHESLKYRNTENVYVNL